MNPRDTSDHLAECATNELVRRLRNAGLKLTQQRIALAFLLFSKGNCHISAEQLFEESQKANLKISMATVYNTINQFIAVGMLRKIPVSGSTAYFDTNLSDHHHFVFDNTIIDVPDHTVDPINCAFIPDDMEVVRIDVVFRLGQKQKNKN